MPALIYGKITGRRIDGKNIRYCINGTDWLATPSGSLVDRSLAHGRYGYFAFDNGVIVDFDDTRGQKETTVSLFDKRSQALKVACERMVQSYQQLSANDRAIVASALATAISGTASVISGIATIASICVGDFTGAVIPGLVTAATGAMAYMSYENMTAAMQRAYDCHEAFIKALNLYHSYTEQYAPEHMKQYPVYDPQFSVYTKIVQAVFPEAHTRDFMYNSATEWQVA